MLLKKKSGPAFNKIESALLTSVMRRDISKAKDYANRHKVKHVFNKAKELIQSTHVDAVYIATPPSTHAELAIMAMKAGKPVYVEKPMATTYQECIEMNKVSEETGVPLFVAYYRRTLPGFLKVKELIDEGTIGKPLSVQIRLTRPALQAEKEKSWRVNKSIAGGGIFYDLASHQFDFLDFALGPIKETTGFASNNNSWYNVEDTVCTSFKFKNGLIGCGLWSFNTHENAKKDTMEIIGTKGTIIFSGFSHSPIQLVTDEGAVEFPYLNPENIQYNLIKQVNEAIINKTPCISTGISAARTNWVLEQIVKDKHFSKTEL
jgi:predicted dehydrogenase